MRLSEAMTQLELIAQHNGFKLWIGAQFRACAIILHKNQIIEKYVNNGKD